MLAAQAACASRGEGWGAARKGSGLCALTRAALCGGPVRPLSMRSSARPQVISLAAAATRGVIAYNPFFEIMPSVGAFSRSLALMRSGAFPVWQCL